MYLLTYPYISRYVSVVLLQEYILVCVVLYFIHHRQRVNCLKSKEAEIMLKKQNNL